MLLTWKSGLMPVTGNLCAVIFSVWITSNVDGRAILEEGNSPNNLSVQACGPRLRLAIESICRNIAQDGSISGLYYNPTILDPQRSTDSHQSDNSLSGRLQHGRSSLSRVPRGVIEVCCKNRCSYNDLVRYCGGPEIRGTTTTSESPETTHPRLEERDAILLPLLLQLLWNNWDNRVYGDSRSLTNFVPQEQPLAGGTARRSRPGAGGRGISPRDIYYQRTFPPMFQSNRQPNSDETLRDRESDAVDDDTSTSTDGNSSQQRRLIQSKASQVTDAPQPDPFPIPAGTNPEPFYIS